MKKRVVVFPAIDASRLAALRAAARELAIVNCDSETAAREAIRTAEGFFGKLTPSLLESAERLEWVQAPTASLEHYIFPALASHPCTLTNMRGLFSDVIADHVMGYVLCFARHLHTYVRQQIAHEWSTVGGTESTTDFIAGPGQVSSVDRAHQHLSDATLGVVGIGAIGREILQRASAFGMKLLGVDPKCDSVPGILDEAWPPERLDNLLRDSDYVVIAAPHTPQTEKMFAAAQFAIMKPTARLINVGRGAIVVLDDLVAALREGTIAGAALDVFETEPLPPDHPLWDMPNVILTPHVAAASPRIAERHLALLAENVRRFAAGEPLLNVADKGQWY